MMIEPEGSALLKMRNHLIETIVYASDEIKKIDNILNGKRPGAGTA
jgi:hypothetical protein